MLGSSSSDDIVKYFWATPTLTRVGNAYASLLGGVSVPSDCLTSIMLKNINFRRKKKDDEDRVRNGSYIMYHVLYE